MHLHLIYSIPINCNIGYSPLLCTDQIKKGTYPLAVSLPIRCWNSFWLPGLYVVNHFQRKESTPKLWSSFLGLTSSTFNVNWKHDGRIICTMKEIKRFSIYWKKKHFYNYIHAIWVKYFRYVWTTQHIFLGSHKIHSILSAEYIHPCGIFGIFQKSHAELEASSYKHYF